MRVGIAGPRRINPEHRAIVSGRIEDLIGEADECTTGACVGVDAYVAGELAAWGLEHDLYETETISRVIVPAEHELVDWDAVAAADEVIRMAPGTTWRDRDDRILDFTDRLIAFDCETLERPGAATGLIASMADARGIPTELVRLP